jgi:hypothetical protein
MAQIRAVIPARRWIYWIQDCLSANRTPTSAASPQPTASSWCRPPPTPATSTPVECHFFPIQEFVVNNADYLDWDAFAWALARHVQNRNPPPRQAHPHPRSPSPDRRLMPFPVKRCEKGH